MSSKNGLPRLECPYFDGETDRYTRMARVLRYTAQQHCPAWLINVQAIAPARMDGLPVRENRYLANSHKLGDWCRAIADAPLGTRMLLIDADTFITNPIDDVWDRNFDLAYTVRQSYMLPFNLGVVFVRVTPETKAFMELWRQQNNLMYGDESYHDPWRKRYGGINQAAFGYLIDHTDHGLHLLTLPCSEWNCENSGWTGFDPELTRIVHVKGALRRLVFTNQAGPLEEHIKDQSELMPLADRWWALEQEAKRAEAA